MVDEDIFQRRLTTSMKMCSFSLRGSDLPFSMLLFPDQLLGVILKIRSLFDIVANIHDFSLLIV